MCGVAVLGGMRRGGWVLGRRARGFGGVTSSKARRSFSAGGWQGFLLAEKPSLRHIAKKHFTIPRTRDIIKKKECYALN